MHFSRMWELRLHGERESGKAGMAANFWLRQDRGHGGITDQARTWVDVLYF